MEGGVGKRVLMPEGKVPPSLTLSPIGAGDSYKGHRRGHAMSPLCGLITIGCFEPPRRLVYWGGEMSPSNL